MNDEKDKKYWCDICEKEVKGKVFKIKNKGFVLYLCSKHIDMSGLYEDKRRNFKVVRKI